ncbi:hypothetical protein FF38_06604, partial [Lucilia cuprina]
EAHEGARGHRDGPGARPEHLGDLRGGQERSVDDEQQAEHPPVHPRVARRAPREGEVLDERARLFAQLLRLTVGLLAHSDILSNTVPGSGSAMAASNTAWGHIVMPLHTIDSTPPPGAFATSIGSPVAPKPSRRAWCMRPDASTSIFSAARAGSSAAGCSAKKEPEVDRDERQHGRHRVAHDVQSDDAAAGHALGPQGAHEVGVHRVDDAAAHEPGDRGETEEGDDQRRQEVGRRPSRIGARDGEPAELQSEDQLRGHGHHEHGDRRREDRPEEHRAVDRAVAAQTREQAEGDAEHDFDHPRRQRERDRDRPPRRHPIRDRHTAEGRAQISGEQPA